MKIRKILAAAAAMTILVSGCGGSGVDTAEIEALLSKAKTTNTKLFAKLKAGR